MNNSNKIDSILDSHPTIKRNSILKKRLSRELNQAIEKIIQESNIELLGKIERQLPEKRKVKPTTEPLALYEAQDIFTNAGFNEAITKVCTHLDQLKEQLKELR